MAEATHPRPSPASHTPHDNNRNDNDDDDDVDNDDDEFYVRYYVGHRGRFGHEFMEFELSSATGKLRYANNSNYKHDTMIRKEVFVSPLVLRETRKIIMDSDIASTKVNGANWKEPDRTSGRQELEIGLGRDKERVTLVCAEIKSLLDVQASSDPEGMKIFYYLIQDLRCLVFSLISLHFKIKPIP